jgi:putative FmdB family regulatory protein
MPLYDFRCRSCGDTFEARTSVDEHPRCPGCGAAHTERQLSGFAGPFTVGLRGAAARRSNAIRRAREEQRRERRANRGGQPGGS